MNGTGAAPDHQTPSEFTRNNNGWSLPCHLSLMNCKSRAESFARSLQGKLRYLSRASGSFNDEHNGENDGAGGSIRSAADSAINAQPSSLVNAGEFDHLVYNERTHLMTTLNAKDVSQVQNYTHNSESSVTTNVKEFGRQLTINHEDELMFDLGFCSPESSNELPRHPLTPSPEFTSIDGHCNSSVIDDIINSRHINIENRHYFINDEVEESGCISSVSSFTIDLSDRVTSSPKPITTQPVKCWPILTDIALLHNQIVELNCDSLNSGSSYSLNNLTMCCEQTDRWEEPSRGFLPITNHQQIILEDIADGKIGASTETESSGITLNAIINGIDDMGIDENEQQIIPTSSEIGGLTNDFLLVNNGDGHLQVNCKENGEHDESNQLKVVPNSHLTDEPNTRLNLSELHQDENGEHQDSTKVETPEDDFPVRVRRCSSLRTGKTPPGTPDRKKIVRFADAMGLDLEDIKTVFLDDLPVVPVSAYKDLDASAYEDDDEDLSCHDRDCILQLVANHHTNVKSPFDFKKPKTNLVPVFPQPGCLPDFFDRLRRQSVCLESAIVTGCSTIRLDIRVVNLDYNKVVSVRYTSNEWKGFQDTLAEYVENSNDVFSDKFHTVIISDHLQVGERLCFAICFKAQGKEYWDNNGGQNYIFQCFPEHDRHPSPPDDSWIHFL
ncbi:hypothetical protein CHUAL_011762 [Chamberlinius hualienensis]